MPTLDLPDGRKLAYREEGSGPPLVLVHGSPGEGRSWGRVVPHLKERFRTICPDLPGYGGSDRLKVDEPVVTGQTAKQVVTLRQGVDTELGKKLQRLIKDSKLKVQAAIQDKQVRVTGKNRDDLQEAIAMVKKGGFDLPLQFTNFRD